MSATGQFVIVPLDAIQVDERMREVKDVNAQAVDGKERSIEALANSLETHGILHPIIITRQFTLLAGERRLIATRTLAAEGRSIKGLAPGEIRCQFADTITQSEQRAIELEENLRRLDMEWQEKAKGVRDYHNLQVAINPAWSQQSTADALGISRTTVSRYCTTATELDKPDSKISRAKSAAAAHRRLAADHQRIVESAMASGMRFDVESGKQVLVDLDEHAAAPAASYQILHADFIDWAANYSGPPFNLIHCDFPYGIGIDGSKTLASGSHITNTYQDSIQVFNSLLRALEESFPRICAPSAHMLFWFPMSRYSTVQVQLSRIGFNVVSIPFIWHKTCNSGLVADMDRAPKNVYEAAFLCSVGDRKVCKTISNVYGSPTENNQHMSAKPVPMLKYVLSALVDSNTRLLDPTCGSGNAVRAAYALGAEYAIGLEIDPDIAKRAQNTLKLDMMKKAAAA